MQAIVTAFDDPWRDELENIWGELKAVFGLKQLAGATRPHLAFHVAEGYAATVKPALAAVAARGAPFAVRTHGLGISRGERAVLYLHVDRTEQLDDVHRVVHRVAGPHARGPRAVYEAATWLPHIALASGPLTDDDVARAVTLLERRPYVFTLPATNLCLVHNTRVIGAEWTRFDLAADRTDDRSDARA